MSNLDSQILGVNTANLTTNLEILEYQIKKYEEMKRQNDRIIFLLEELLKEVKKE